MKIDKRKKYILMVDTETCPLNPGEKCSGDNSLVYDVGFLVTDKKGYVYATGSYIVQEIFFGEKKRMNSAYYASKIAQYEKEISKGKRVVASWWKIKNIISKMCAENNVSVICAHNARFDWLATRNTSLYLSDGRQSGFLPYLEIWDTMLMCRVIANTVTYKSFCVENNFLTKRGLPQIKAEILYRFITRDTDFAESHTGLEDCYIERIILRECLKKHKKMKKKLFEKK